MAAAEPDGAPALTLHDARERFERDFILRALAAQQGNISRTAEILGVERSNLYRKMRAFGIVPARHEEERRVGLIRLAPLLLFQSVFQHLVRSEPFDLQIELGRRHQRGRRNEPDDLALENR